MLKSERLKIKEWGASSFDKWFLTFFNITEADKKLSGADWCFGWIKFLLTPVMRGPTTLTYCLFLAPTVNVDSFVLSASAMTQLAKVRILEPADACWDRRREEDADDGCVGGWNVMVGVGMGSSLRHHYPGMKCAIFQNISNIMTEIHHRVVSGLAPWTLDLRADCRLDSWAWETDDVDCNAWGHCQVPGLMFLEAVKWQHGFL